MPAKDICLGSVLNILEFDFEATIRVKDYIPLDSLFSLKIYFQILIDTIVKYSSQLITLRAELVVCDSSQTRFED